jgi:hypothetical protein
VLFGEIPAQSSAVSTNESTITAYSPSAQAGNVDITVTTPAGISPLPPGDHFTYS